MSNQIHFDNENETMRPIKMFIMSVDDDASYFFCFLLLLVPLPSVEEEEDKLLGSQKNGDSKGM